MTVAKSAIDVAVEVENLRAQWQLSSEQTPEENRRRQRFSVVFWAAAPDYGEHDVVVQLRVDDLDDSYRTHWLTFRGIDDESPWPTTRVWDLTNQLSDALEWLLGTKLCRHNPVPADEQR